MTMQEDYRCPECGAAFPSRSSLEEHTGREHGHMGAESTGHREMERIACPECGQRFSTEEEMERHSRAAH